MANAHMTVARTFGHLSAGLGKMTGGMSKVLKDQGAVGRQAFKGMEELDAKLAKASADYLMRSENEDKEERALRQAQMSGAGADKETRLEEAWTKARQKTHNAKREYCAALAAVNEYQTELYRSTLPVVASSIEQVERERIVDTCDALLKAVDTAREAAASSSASLTSLSDAVSHIDAAADLEATVGRAATSLREVPVVLLPFEPSFGDQFADVFGKTFALDKMERRDRRRLRREQMITAASFAAVDLQKKSALGRLLDTFGLDSGSTAAPAVRPTGRVIHRGWMEKQGTRLRQWHWRWFVLRGRSLCYYKKSVQESTEPPSGVIELPDGVIIRPSQTKAGSAVFEVDVGTRVYLLQAKSGADRAVWMAKLSEATLLSAPGITRRPRSKSMAPGLLVSPPGSPPHNMFDGITMSGDEDGSGDDEHMRNFAFDMYDELEQCNTLDIADPFELPLEALHHHRGHPPPPAPSSGAASSGDHSPTGSTSPRAKSPSPTARDTEAYFSMMRALSPPGRARSATTRVWPSASTSPATTNTITSTTTATATTTTTTSTTSSPLEPGKKDSATRSAESSTAQLPPLHAVGLPAAALPGPHRATALARGTRVDEETRQQLHLTAPQRVSRPKSGSFSAAAPPFLAPPPPQMSGPGGPRRRSPSRPANVAAPESPAETPRETQPSPEARKAAETFPAPPSAQAEARSKRVRPTSMGPLSWAALLAEANIEIPGSERRDAPASRTTAAVQQPQQTAAPARIVGPVNTRRQRAEQGSASAGGSPSISASPSSTDIASRAAFGDRSEDCLVERLLDEVSLLLPATVSPGSESSPTFPVSVPERGTATREPSPRATLVTPIAGPISRSRSATVLGTNGRTSSISTPADSTVKSSPPKEVLRPPRLPKPVGEGGGARLSTQSLSGGRGSSDSMSGDPPPGVRAMRASQHDSALDPFRTGGSPEGTPVALDAPGIFSLWSAFDSAMKALADAARQQSLDGLSALVTAALTALRPLSAVLETAKVDGGSRVLREGLSQCQDYVRLMVRKKRGDGLGAAEWDTVQGLCTDVEREQKRLARLLQL